MDAKTVEFQPFQDQKPGTYVTSQAPRQSPSTPEQSIADTAL